MEPIFLSGENLTMGTRQKTEPDSRGNHGHFVKQWRKHRKMNQEQLAAAVGVATSGISQLESGKQGYSQKSLEALAVALRCTPAELISVNPETHGELTDLLKLITDDNRAHAVKVLKAFLELTEKPA